MGDDFFDALMYGLMTGRSGTSQASTAAVTTPSASAALEMLKMMERASKAMNSRREAMHDAFGPINGLLRAQVQRHCFPPTIVPNRVHKRRKGQSLRYHLRVQKKWAKRWGTREQQHAYLVDSRAFDIVPGPRRDVLVLPEGWPAGWP